MYLSSLDERFVYESNLRLYRAENERILLGNSFQDAHWYTDLISGYGSCNFGHCNPAIRPFDACNADLAACFYPEEAYSFSEWLLTKLKLAGQSEVLIQVGGSFAVSTSIAMAQRFKPGKVVYLKGSFHGLGMDSLSVTSAQRRMALQDTEVLSLIADQYLQIDPSVPVSESRIFWPEVSCVIFEPIQGANGYIPLDVDWLKELVSTAKRHEVTVIADEIQCGYFRHGFFSVSHQYELAPDICLFSKSLTNGLFPFSLVVYDKRFKNKLSEKLYLAHTFQTSALGCYAMSAVANFIDQNPVEHYCADLNAVFEGFASELRQVVDSVSDIYVTGPTISFKSPDSKELVKKLFKEKILIFTGGNEGERVRIAPPITISKVELKQVLHKITEVFEGIAV